ncbi:MAG: AAA family ATPase [Alteromonadaceae bacterium]|nr:AAA family ATPase [Alteromonadaceae bacterium]
MLTEEQAGTIKTPHEHKLICALPGSGKTHTFIRLVAEILKTPKANILMVTFSKASALEMQKRVLSVCGSAAAKRVTTKTFASLMLNQFKPIKGDRRLMMGPEQISFLKRALSEIKQRYTDINKWVEVIEELGRDIDYEYHPDNPEHRVYEAYLARMRRYKRFDLNMAAKELVLGMQTGNVKPLNYTNILCDEFQDTDDIQYQWLRCHGEHGAKLAVVGDDDQSIYGFRGSMGFRAFTAFQQDFTVKGYYLSRCFRCAENILKSAQSLIEENEGSRVKKKMIAHKAGGEVRCVEIPRGYESEYTRNLMMADLTAAAKSDKNKKESVEHYRFVAERIKQSERTGWAVLARTNKQLDEMESALTALGVATVRIGGKSVFDNEHAVGIMGLLNGVANPKNTSALITGLGWLGEKEEVLQDIFPAAQQYGFSAAIPAIERPWSAATQYFQKMSNSAMGIGESSMDKFFKVFFQAVDSFIHKRNDDDKKLQLVISEICHGVMRRAKGGMLQRLRLLDEKARKNKTPDVSNDGVVVLSTMNGAKGLEWPSVWIVDVETKKVPFIKGDLTLEAIQEERRLVYVAMTRAEEYLMLSYREARGSEFLDEIEHVKFVS